jgi:hypothetical protein
VSMYTRTFYKESDGFASGNMKFRAEGGTANERLGLPAEDLDEATRTAVKMTETGEASYRTSRAIDRGQEGGAYAEQLKFN